MSNLTDILIDIVKRFFAAEDEFNNYRGPDKYSSITTDFTDEYVKVSDEYFSAKNKLLKKLDFIFNTPTESLPFKMEKSLYWSLKTWYDINLLATENPSRMLANNDLSDLCGDIMSLSFKINEKVKDIVKKI